VDSNAFILERIPHRPPFLWVDRVVRLDGDTLIAEKTIPVDLDIFQGHYPQQPIVPGVLLCEAIFQAGAILIAELLRQKSDGSATGLRGVPVLTRISGARFKRAVKPGETITLEVKLQERIGPAWFLKGKALVHDKTAVKVEFACALSESR
jgi:3-hydroxyacyl-[acyl-carrier-protein] dehydratase